MEDLTPIMDGRYGLTRDGRVWSFPKRRKPKGSWIQPHKTIDGYLRVNLTPIESAGYRTFLIHTLMLETFVGPACGREAHHKDHNRQNNSIANLQWVSHQDNVRLSWSAKRRTHKGERNTNAVLTEADVHIIRQRKHRGENRALIAADYNVTPGHISMICNGRAWPHLGDV